MPLCLIVLHVYLSYPVEIVSPFGDDMGMDGGKAKDSVKEKLLTQLLLRGLTEVYPLCIEDRMDGRWIKVWIP